MSNNPQPKPPNNQPQPQPVANKKPDLKQVLNDRIGDFVRLAGTLDKLKEQLPVQAERSQQMGNQVAGLTEQVAKIFNNLGTLHNGFGKMSKSVEQQAAAYQQKLITVEQKATALESNLEAFLKAISKRDKQHRITIYSCLGVIILLLLTFGYFEYKHGQDIQSLSNKLDAFTKAQQSAQTPPEDKPSSKPKK
jgi:ABC-type transporter Mla subunit MlaD